MKPGYKQTEVGVIPEDWEAAKLGNFISLQRGYDLTWRDRRNGDVPVMGSAGQNGFHNEAIAKGPGVVIGRSGASFGQAHYCEPDFWPHNTALYVTDFRGNDPLYAFYLLSAADFSRHNSGGAQQSLNRNFIAPICIGVPRPIEQRAISEALGDVDALLGALDRLIAKKRDLKQATMQQLLTGQTRLPGFEGEWEVSVVGLEFEIRLGKMLDAEKNVGVPKPYVGNKAVQWNRIDISDLSTVPMTRSDTERYRLQKGDLLVCEGGEVGRAAIWDAPIDECYFQKALHRLRPLRGFNSRLMAAFLRLWSEHGRFSNYVTQTSIAHLPREKFMDVPLPVPPPSEQTAIADVLSDMDAELAELERRRDKTRMIKQGMMQELLTGRTRLL